MIDPNATACVLLAAGRSLRYGFGNKLAASFRGRPLGEYAAETLAGIAFARHIAVVSEATESIFAPPFESVTNPAPQAGLSSSIALGVKAAAKHGVDAVIVALADMPLVPQSHFHLLLRAFDPSAGADVIATEHNGRAQVPALFSMPQSLKLFELTGDTGARELLRTAKRIPCDPALLTDFDQPSDFKRPAPR